MQSVTVICVGKLKEAYWRDAAAEYCKRLGAFCKIAVAEIEEERLPQNPSQAQIDAGVKTIMVSHSALNGVKMHENKEFIEKLKNGLRG